METIEKKRLLYKSKVEYMDGPGVYTMNHVQGCAHGCRYPCYAYLAAKRFGTVGAAVFECGAYGIAFEDVIDWDAITGKIKECTGCDNRPDFCFNDNFISFWELLWNFNCDDCCSVVEKA